MPKYSFQCYRCGSMRTIKAKTKLSAEVRLTERLGWLKRVTRAGSAGYMCRSCKDDK